MASGREKGRLYAERRRPPPRTACSCVANALLLPTSTPASYGPVRRTHRLLPRCRRPPPTLRHSVAGAKRAMAHLMAPFAQSTAAAMIAKPPAPAKNSVTLTLLPPGAICCGGGGKRAFLRGMIAAGAGSLLLGGDGGIASAASKRRAPPPVPEERKDPSVSGVQAKVLASKKRKEAMKEFVAKMREKGKPVNN